MCFMSCIVFVCKQKTAYERRISDWSSDVCSSDLMVFQNYAFYPHMTVYDNMAYGLKIARKSKADIERRVQEAAQILELQELLRRKPRELSGGQRQRVAMGRAIVRPPARSEERRVGKECVSTGISRWAPAH